MERKPVALGLAGASLALAVAFGLVMWLAGGVQWSPGSETYDLAVHPLTPVWAAFAVAGLATLAAGKAWPSIVLGALGLALGVVSGFSAGFYGIGSGALLLAAGLVGRRPSVKP